MTTEAPAPPAERAGRPRTRRRWRRIAVAVVVVVLVAAGVVAARWEQVSRLWRPEPAQAARTYSGGPTATATVARQDLAAREQVDGTLGYADTYTVLGKSHGTVTWVPDTGTVIRQGEAAYKVDGDPVLLLYGATPAYRDLAEGASGADVKELNHDLSALGYADDEPIDSGSDYFGAATAAAVTRMQDDKGLTEDGVLHLGQAVFLGSAVRVTSVPATPGGPADGPLLKGTSTTRQVTVDLDASRQSEVKKGDKVTITLPNDDTTPGTVTKVGTVATAAQDGGSDSGASPAPTVEVDIAPRHPSATGHVDQGPVRVEITTSRVKDALVVPVTALLATTGGGYAVEAVDPDGRHRLVPVTTGTFDDAAGLVQVTGAGLSEGQKIVVAAS